MWVHLRPGLFPLGPAVKVAQVFGKQECGGLVRVCTFFPEQGQAQGKTHSRSVAFSPISQMRKLRPGKSDSSNSHPMS